ncbi:MAG: hypothetical protein ACTS73_01435 [Arsenophonus sp. NEOnobi-MAG3]
MQLTAYFPKRKNRTVNKVVLHIALRNCKNTLIKLDGVYIMPQVNPVLAKKRCFNEALINAD